VITRRCTFLNAPCYVNSVRESTQTNTLYISLCSVKYSALHTGRAVYVVLTVRDSRDCIDDSDDDDDDDNR